MPNILEATAADIRLVVFDVDGVMTDGKLYFADNGDEIKAFNVRDGLGIKLLHDAGLQTAIITGRESRLVQNRARNLGIHHLYQGREDKLVALRELLDNLQLPLGAAAYLGDDLPDLPAIRHAGLGATVGDASPVIKAQADWVSQARGGHGAVREFCEQLLAAQGKLDALLSRYTTDQA